MAFETGAMMVDMMVVELFMGVAQAINDSPDSGVAMNILPMETVAAAQTEVNSSPETGSSLYYTPSMGGGGGSGDIYPI